MLGSRQRIAQALLQLNISQFQRAAQAAIATSRTLSTGVTRNFQTINTALSSNTTRSVSRVAQGFRDITQASQEFARTDLGRLNTGLREVEQNFRGISVAAGLVATLGIREASNLQRQNALLKVFSRTQEGLINNQQQIRDFATETSQSYLTTLEAANAILPTVNRYKIDLGQVLSIIQRLAILDPAQGTGGAAFAIREALSGAGRSLAARFELPLSQVNGIIKGAAGDPQKVIEGLNTLVDQLGLTQEAFLELQNSGVNSLDRLGGTIREALGTAFTPALQRVIIPLADGLNNLLNQLSQTNPQLLALAGTGTIIVAGLTPVLLILTQLINMFGVISTFLGTGSGAGILAGLKGIATVAGGAIASVGGGILAGAGVAQLMANSGNRSGDLGRIADGENVFSVLWERIRQLMFITINTLVTAFAAIVATIKKADAYLDTAIFNLGKTIEIGGERINQAISQLVISIGDALIGVASVLGAFGGTEVNAIGELLKVIGQASSNQAEDNITRLEGQYITQNKLDARFAEIDTEMENFSRNFGQGLLDVLGLRQVQEVAEAARPVSLINQLFGVMRTAAEGVGSALQGVIPAMIDATTKISEMNEELALTVQRRNEQRGIEDERQLFDDILADYRKVSDFRRSLAQDDADFYESQLQKSRDFYDDLDEIETDSTEEQLELQKKLAQDGVRAAEDHGRTLARIERETRENVQKSARRLDASGVTEAYRNGRRQLEEANEQYDTERRRRQEDYVLRLEEIRSQAVSERDERIRAFNQELVDDQNQYNHQRQRRVDEFNRQLAEEAYDRQISAMRRAEDRAREDRIEQEDHQRRIQALWNTVYTESMLWANLRDVVTGAASGIRAAIASIFNVGTSSGLGGAAGGAPGSSGSSTTTGRSVFPTLTETSRVSVDGKLRYHYAMGGTPPLNQPVLVGERGVEVVQFTSPVKIHSSESSVTRGMMRGAAPGLQIGTFAPVFGIPNLESVAGELHRRMEQTILQFASEYAQYRGA